MRQTGLGVSRPTVLGNGELYALAAVCLMTASILFQRAASQTAHPVAGAFLTQLPMGLLGTILVATRHSSDSVLGRTSRRAILSMIFATAFTFVIAPPLYFRALSISGTAIVTSVQASSVFWAAFLAWVFLRQPLSRLTLRGLLLFVAGLFVLSLSGQSFLKISSQWYLGIPLTFAVAFLNAFSLLLTGYSMTHGLSARGSVFINGVVAVVGLGVLSLLGNAPFPVSSRTMLYLFAGGVFQALNVIAFNAALARTTVVSVGTITTSVLVWTTLLAWIFLNEPLNLPILAALALILTGLIIAQLGRR